MNLTMDRQKKKHKMQEADWGAFKMGFCGVIIKVETRARPHKAT